MADTGPHRRQTPWSQLGRLMVVLLLMAASSAAHAQVTTGVVAVAVRDPTGAAVAGATVRGEDALHGVTRAGETDASGLLRLVDLPPGTYVISASAPGFAEASQPGVVVAVHSAQRLELRLALAGISQTVEVRAKAPQVQADSPELSTVLDQGRVSGIPLNRRDFLQLSMLSAGVGPPVQDSELSTRGSFAMHANGAREQANNFLLDGVDNNDPYVNRYGVQPPVDGIQEFKVVTSTYSAEYGRNAGGQVNVVTRRGTNRLQGFVYDYFRDRALDAGNYFETGDAREFTRQQLGGGVGGPIVRDRTFFFGTIDYLRAREGLTRLVTVPTEAERVGDLSGLARPVVDPFTGKPFPNNQIPQWRISPVAPNVLALFPLPNLPGSVGNYLSQPVQRDDTVQGTVRVDHQLTASDQLTVRYSQGDVDLFEPYTEDFGTAPGFGDYVRDSPLNAMAQWQRVVSARTVNTLRVGYNRFKRDLLPENYTVNAASEWGVGWLPADVGGYPVFNVAGYSRVGDAATLPIVRSTETWHVSEGLTLDRGAHLFGVGGEVRYVTLRSQLDYFERGQMSFSGAFTGAGIGDLLLGFPTFGMQAQADNPMHLRSTAVAVYAQDEWRARPDLTLSLGVRYEYMSPPTDPNDRMSTLDADGNLVQVGTNGTPRGGFWPDWNNVAPRVGLAWSPSSAFVVRGGYGVYYDAGILTVSTTQYFNPPYFTLRVYFPTATSIPTLANPFPTTGGVTPPASLSVLNPDMVTASMQHWNLAVEREIGQLGTATLAYAGSRGSSLVRPRDLNQPRPAPGPVQIRRPDPAYGSIFYVESEGRSTYHSLQAGFNRPLRNGVSVWAVYTLAKSMDDASAFLPVKPDRNFPQDSENLAAEWAPSSYDVRHRLTAAWIWELPQGSAWTRDTHVSGVFTASSGLPFTPLLRFDNSNTGNGGQNTGWDRPNLVGSPEVSSPSPDAWFNPAAFAVPPQYTFGNAGRNGLRAPGYASFDVAVARRVRLGGSLALTVEAQVFNLFNRANFDLPEPYADEPATFGRIFSARAPRQVQLAARMEF